MTFNAVSAGAQSRLPGHAPAVKPVGWLKSAAEQVLLKSRGVVSRIYWKAEAPEQPDAMVEYQGTTGFCKSATLEEIKANDYVLTPSRYVGVAEVEDDGIPFETKMTELSQKLYRQMEQAEKLDAQNRKNLEGLGYGG